MTRFPKVTRLAAPSTGDQQLACRYVRPIIISIIVITLQYAHLQFLQMVHLACLDLYVIAVTIYIRCLIANGTMIMLVAGKNIFILIGLVCSSGVRVKSSSV